MSPKSSGRSDESSFSGTPSQLASKVGDLLVPGCESGSGRQAAISSSLGPAAERKSTAQLMQRRVEELAAGFSDTLDSMPSYEAGGQGRPVVVVDWVPQMVSRVLGILPWSERERPWMSTSYRFSIVGLSCLSLSVVTVRAAFALAGILRGHQYCGQFFLLSDLLLAAGTACAVVLLCTGRRRQKIADNLELLHLYAARTNTVGPSRKLMQSDGIKVLVVWLLAISIGMYNLLGEGLTDGDVDMEALAQLGSFTVASGLFCCLALLIAFVSRMQTLVVDTFCVRCCKCPDLRMAAHEWNTFQAVLRKASMAMEVGFVPMLVVGLLSVPALMADRSVGCAPAARMAPGVIVTALVVRTLLLAGAVTDRCTRVPPLINSLSFGAGTERKKLEIVEYIKNSDAGFYVFDLRLTTGMTLKSLYLWSAVAFAVFAKLSP